MGKWNKYKVENTQNARATKWNKYKIVPAVQEQGDSWPALLGKSALKGVASIGDIPSLAGELTEGFKNRTSKMYGAPVGMYGMGLKGVEAAKPNIRIDNTIPNTDYSSYIPTMDNARGVLKESAGIDLEPNPTTPAQRIASNTAEFAGSLSPWGALNAANKAKGAMNFAKTGAGIGVLSGTAKEAGADPMVADIVSSIIAPGAMNAAKPKNIYSAFQRAKEVSAKAPMKLMGLSPKRIDLEAAKAAKDLGIDLPAAALTDSTLTGLADQWVGKTPFFGNKLKNKYATTEEQTRKALEDIYEKVGPAKTPEIEARIANLYDQRVRTLPEEAMVKPANTVKALGKIKTDSALLSPDEKNLMESVQTLQKEFNPKIATSYGDINIPLQGAKVNKLADTKRSLNSIIKWEKDEGVKNQRRNIQKALADDIAQYGKENPEWYKTFSEADNLYGSVAKRENLENLLSNKGTNYASGNLSYNALSKAINNPKNAKLIKKQVGPETFKKIENLGIVARAMAQKAQRIPNPSGTAMTAATIGIVSSLYANPIATLSGSGIGAVIGARVATQLLTDKKFLDFATKLAETPNKQNIATYMALNKRIKDITGYSAIALNKAVSERRIENNEEEVE